MAPERRPPFARAFPRDPKLDALVEAFERGDYARVRAEAPNLGLTTRDEGIKQATRILIVRTKPDVLAVGLLALAAAFVAVVSVWWITHGDAPTEPAPRELVR